MAVERSLLLIKKDGMSRNLAGEIISRYQKPGFKLIAAKVTKVTEEFAKNHYRATDEQITGMGEKTLKSVKELGNPEDVMRVFGTEDPREIGVKLLEWTVKMLATAPVLAFVLEGEDCIKEIRKITGFTNPAMAEKGTVRGDLGEDDIAKANIEGRPVMNLVHASGNAEEAKLDIAHWFTDEELFG